MQQLLPSFQATIQRPPGDEARMDGRGDIHYSSLVVLSAAIVSTGECKINFCCSFRLAHRSPHCVETGQCWMVVVVVE